MILALYFGSRQNNRRRRHVELEDNAQSIAAHLLLSMPQVQKTIDTAAVNCPFRSVSTDPTLAEAAGRMEWPGSTKHVAMPVLCRSWRDGFVAMIGFYLLVVAVAIMMIRC